MVRYSNLGAGLLPDAPADQPAIVDLGVAPPRTLTYAGFDALCDAAARGFRRRGLMPSDRVAVIAANSADYLAAVYGALRAGLAIVPINTKQPAATIAFMLKESAARLVVHDEANAALVPDGFTSQSINDGAFEAFCDPGPFEMVIPGEDDISMIIYTSGSSGTPKGVVFSHRGHLWGLDRRTDASSPRGRRTIVAAPLYHQNGLASAQATLGSGGSVLLLPRFETKSFIRTVADYRVEMVTAVPTMIAMALKEKALIESLDFTHVRLVRISSAPSTPKLIEDIRAIFPNAAVVNGFGTTEGGPIFFGPHPDRLKTPPMSVGCAHPDVELRLMENGQEVDRRGELEIRSPALMRGYLNRPDLTARVMTEDGFYRTGDIFERDADGFFTFARRVDDMFVCGGENIFPGDVEAMLMRHPAIQAVCVVPVPDEIKGFKPVAFVVPRAGETVDPEDVKRFALENAPAYQHPRRVLVLDELPLAGTNKIDRKRLAEQALAALTAKKTKGQEKG
ncbi:class I adenylate-forming enzyme family protein [Martelella sp. AMO21009]